MESLQAEQQNKQPGKAGFWRGAFSDFGEPSSSRVLSALALVATIGWISHVVWHTHAMPDPVATAALAAFSTSHYLVNKGAAAFAKSGTA